MRILSTSPPSVPSKAVRQVVTWQDAMKAAIRSGTEVCRRLQLPERMASAHAAADFSVFVPWEYLAKMRVGDANDPLLRQVLPVVQETENPVGFSLDPVSDATATLKPGLLKKYHGRALLVTTGACAVHCRYCFRRHYPYGENSLHGDTWQQAIAAIASDPTIHEVLLSGGDPLTLVDDRLAELIERLARIRHLCRLRIHTRLPVMISQRVTNRLVRLLATTRLTPIVVLHANHANELVDDVPRAIGRLIDAGIPLLNQSVLLRGINDCLESLVELSERLTDLRVMPYYLHQLDRVRGAHHFEVPVERGLRLLAAMRERLPGYAVPKYVQEIVGGLHKTVLA